MIYFHIKAVLVILAFINHVHSISYRSTIDIKRDVRLSVRSETGGVSSDSSYMYATEYMYKKGRVAGPNTPKITITFDQYNDNMTSFIAILNYEDMNGLGVPTFDNSETFISCGSKQIAAGYCTEQARGMFIANPAYSWKYNHYNGSQTFNTSSDTAQDSSKYDISWDIDSTGQYIVLVYALRNSIAKFPAFTVTFLQPYGLLPAQEYPKWPFYGTLTGVYLLVAIFWGYSSYRYRRDLLPVQNYLFCLCIVLLLEVFCQFEYYRKWNSYGQSSGMLYTSIIFLNALRNAASTFMLLVVALGFGVVKPSLGQTMRKCVLLASAHLVFGLVYAYGTMLSTEKLSSFVLMVLVIPISVVMTIFYYWTLNAFTQTILLLQLRRQHVKLKMYRNLWRLLLFSCMMVLVYCIIFLVFSAKRADTEFRLKHWQSRWFLTDGYLNMLYLAVFLGIIYMWRPTKNNQRYGLEQLPDDNDFENSSNIFDSFADNDSGTNIELDVRAGDEPAAKTHNAFFFDSRDTHSSQALFSHSSLDDGHSSSKPKSSLDKPKKPKSPPSRHHNQSSLSDNENEEDILKWAEANFGSKS